MVEEERDGRGRQGAQHGKLDRDNLRHWNFVINLQGAIECFGQGCDISE